jgi:hypothetical protein
LYNPYTLVVKFCKAGGTADTSSAALTRTKTNHSKNVNMCQPFCPERLFIFFGNKLKMKSSFSVIGEIDLTSLSNYVGEPVEPFACISGSSKNK